MKNKLSYVLGLLIVVLFVSCSLTGGYPLHTVAVGHQNLIVYKCEKINDQKYGTYRYAIADTSGKDWTLYTFEQYNIGDTVYISTKKR